MSGHTKTMTKRNKRCIRGRISPNNDPFLPTSLPVAVVAMSDVQGDDVASRSTFTLEDSAICLTSEQSTVDVDIDRDDGSVLDVYL